MVDDKGTAFHFKEAPKRIITTSLPYQDILFELVPTDRFVAVSSSSADPDYSMTAEASAKIANRFTPPISVEQVLQYKPDVFITSENNARLVTATLQDMGVNVFVINTIDSYDDIKHVIAKLAELVHEQEKGAAMIARLDADRAALERRLAQIPADKQKIVLEITYNGTYGMLQRVFAMLCDLAHTRNGMLLMPVHGNMAISKEKLMELNPDVLFLPAWSARGSQNSDAYLEQVKNDPAYKDLKFIRNNAVYKFPERYRYCSSQHIIEAAEYMARLTYPEYLK